MEPKEFDLTSEEPDRTPSQPPDQADPPVQPEQNTQPNRPDKLPKPEKKISLKWTLFSVCLAVVAAILLTYTLTAESQRRKYTQKLLAQQKVIDQLNGADDDAIQNLQLLNTFIERYSYYANSLNEQEMLEAAFKAYVQASGDRYAQYYTEAEYLAYQEQNAGNRFGIGVTVMRETTEINGSETPVFRIDELYANAPAEKAGLAVGDLIYAVMKDGSYETLAALGYDGALNAIQGEEGTPAQLKIFRKMDGEYVSMDVTVIRGHFESISVRGSLMEGNPTVGVVKISSFDLTTPHQFKDRVNALLEQGAKHFVFDVRSNPGGDLESIRAVLSYFLQEGDMVLSAIDKNQKVAATYLVEVSTHTGDYAGCSVSKEEIGMYAGLDMVILCNENTASAAEVFTATMRDYGLAKTVGQTTFGKGIMQTTLRIPFKGIVGYIKLTTYAYVTKCGVSYHGTGIVPDVGAELSEEAKQYSISSLPHHLDQQLQTAVTLFQSTNQNQ